MFIELSPAMQSRLRASLKADQLLFDEASIEKVTRTCIPFRTMPSAVVYPTSTEQVQQVIVAAVELDVPVWPLSTGKNWGYGERTATFEGGIVMLLERMTTIVHVDETLGYAVLEPGVTYAQLNEHLKKTGSRLWADCTGSTPFASVIGNALDKGRGLTPYADHFNALCGLDVVMPSGELLETGGAAQGNSHVRHLYKWGIGPYLDGLFAQSNLGVVVRAGVWLMPAPEAFDFAAFEFTAPSEKLPAFIDDLRELVFCRAMRSYPHFANDFALMCIQAQYPYERLAPGEKHLSEKAMLAWRQSHGVTSWTFAFGLYGSPDEVRYQRRTLRTVLGRYGLVRFVGAVLDDSLKGALIRFFSPIVNRLLGKSDEFEKAMLPAIGLYRGEPTEYFVRQAYVRSKGPKPNSDIDPARDGFGLVWLGPVVPFTSEHVMKAIALAKKVSDEAKFDFFIEVIIESARSVILLLGVYYDRNVPAEAERAGGWYEQAREEFNAAGYPSYRASTPSMKGLMHLNAPAENLLKQLKLAVDPKNVIAPGRYGTPVRER